MEAPPPFDSTLGVAGNLEAMEGYMIRMGERSAGCVGGGRSFEQWLHAIAQHVSARDLLPLTGIVIDEQLHREGQIHGVDTLLRIQNAEGQVLAVVENGTIVRVRCGAIESML
jgi:hypothetical protein